MRKSPLALSLMLILVMSAAAFSAENELFSRVRPGSVFAAPSPSEAGPSAPETGGESPQTIIEAGQLSDLLRRAGFEPKMVGARAVSVKQKLEPWSFPVVVTLSADQRHLQLVLLLAEIEDPKRLTSERLLALMNASRRHAPSFYAYSSERKRLELFHTVQNRGLTSVQLRDEITRLAELARQSEALWRPSGGSQAGDGSKPPSPAATDGAGGGATELVGRWSASRSSKEAFALQLNRDGSFVLVYVRDGKQSRSQGSFTRSGSSLQLRARNLTLSGTLSQVSSRQFTLQLENAPKPLTFKRAS